MGDRAVEPWPFACRDAEMDLVDAHGAAGAVLTGVAGVGKSRLLAELVRREERAGRRVVRVVATQSLAAVPFGAFAGVLERAPDPGAPFDVLQRLLRALAHDGDVRDAVIAVDDAHLLDDGSAGLVFLAAQSGARVLATTRSGAASPDAITRLWKDGVARLVELDPLDEDEVGTLLRAALGGPLDGRARRRLFEVTLGNLLFLRELVRAALEEGTLVERGGVWSWTAPTVDAAGVHELVVARLAGLSPEVLDLVELLAVGEPLGSALVRDVCSDAVLAEAERDGLVVVHTSGLRSDLRLVHPVYADVVRESLGGSRRRALSLRLARLLETTGGRRQGDRLRGAVLRLDAGDVGETAILHAASRDAIERADMGLAARVARAARAAGGGSRSDVLLGEALYWSGRHTEVIDLLGPVVDTAPPEDAASASYLVASALAWGLGRFDDADACLERGERCAGMPHALELQGQRAELLMVAGRALEAIEVGQGVVDHPDASTTARLRAYGGLLPAKGVHGRLDEVDADLPTAMELVTASASDLAFASGGVMVGVLIAGMFSGGLDELDGMMGALYDDALGRVDDPFRGFWPFMLGRSALTQGRLAEATTWLADAAALLRDRDPGGMLPWALAALAQATGATGDAGRATRAMAEVEQVHISSMHHIDIDVELGRAWAASARGERSHAREIAEKIGRLLVDDGRIAIGALALHDALRLGTTPAVLVDTFDVVAATCGTVVFDAFAAHAHALVDDDGDGLLRAADLFEAAGWRLHAAECVAEASRIAGEHGLRARQRDAVVRFGELIAPCGPARTPMLESIAGKSALGSLTRREQEIALMAANGFSKREIAETLLLSLRTVGNHINHVYGKLGITSRDELRVAIGAADPTPEEIR